MTRINNGDVQGKGFPLYNAFSIYRGHFSLNNSRKTPHSLRARYGVSFVSAKFDRSFVTVIIGLCA